MTIGKTAHWRLSIFFYQVMYQVSSRCVPKRVQVLTYIHQCCCAKLMSPHQHPGNSAGVTDESDTRVAFLAVVSLDTPVCWLAVVTVWFQIFNLWSLLAAILLSASDTRTQKLAFDFYQWQILHCFHPCNVKTLEHGNIWILTAGDNGMTFRYNKVLFS